jgi:hypothetical protein
VVAAVVVGVALVAMPRSSAAGSLALVGVSLQGTPVSAQVVLTANWGGETLLVYGSASGTPASPSVTIGGQACTAPALSADSTSGSTGMTGFTISCVVPVLSQTISDVTVSMGGATATLTNAVLLPVPPTIASIAGCTDQASGSTTQCPEAGGITVTVSGSRLLANTWAPIIGDSVCALLPQSSTSSARCVLPPGSGTEPVLLAWSGGVVNTGLTVSYAATPATAPTVTSIAGCTDLANGSTTQCPDAGGITMSLSGANLPASGWSVIIGDGVCGPLSQASASSASCVLPAGSGTEPVLLAWSGGVVNTGLTVAYAGPPPLAAPTGVVAAPGDGQATVSWSTAADPGATAYQVTPSTAAGPLPAVTFAVPAGGVSGAMSEVVGGLANGTAVTFTVAAVEGSQIGAASDPSAAVVPAGVPGAPTGVSARAGRPGTVVVSWTAPSSDGGSAITGYAVTPFLKGVAQTAVAVTGTSATLKLGGGTYVFEVAALNAAGSGAPSTPSAPVRVGGRPAKPGPKPKR